MRASFLYAPTLRETPAEAEVVSHQLMLRAGFIRKAAGGIYNYLPLAWRVIRKIEQIVREEMDGAGGQELLLPIVLPAEMWQETGRWDVYGDEMFRLKDRHGRNFCLGPTHEEMITTLIRDEVRSYRQLPLMLYQIQNKFRDERRPRFGLMRGREFIMKDLYSFDRDEAGLDVSYKKMYDAYSRVFDRCGLTYRPVEADPGAIGGKGSHEFMVIADSGEAAIVYCGGGCAYAANVEKAELHPLDAPAEEPQPLELKDTPGTKTIAAVAAFLGLPADRTVKTLAYATDKGLVIALVRGDHEVNEIKVQNAVGCISLDMADEAAIAAAGTAPGFMGPIGIKNAIVIADATVMRLHNTVVGANQPDRHYVNVNPGRDFKPDLVADIRLIQEGDPCPRCGTPVKAARGIEVGQVFKLYTKYSQKLNATYLDENGQEHPMVMGTYGIGVTRTMAAAIEQNNDAHGIIWPAAIAPFQAVVIPVNNADPGQRDLAERVYGELAAAGVEVVLDDRDERAGVKFKDADLIGYPLKITVGAKAVTERQVEVKTRRSGEVRFFPLAEATAGIKELLATL
jgi:prolyl-tRNA synthetase